MGGSIGAIAAGGIGALVGASSGGGKGAQFMPPTAYMPEAQRTAFEQTFLGAMSQPTSMPITYGGQQFALPRQFPVQAAAQYGAVMQPVQTAGPTPSPLSGALTAMAGMAPYLMNQPGAGFIPYTPPPDIYRPSGITNPLYPDWGYE